jgi:excinuclease ABC subunit B
MRRAIDETNRRRKKQLEFNAEHGITPRGIQKGVSDIMEGARFEAGRPESRRRAGQPGKAGGVDLEETLSAAEMRPELIVRRIKKLETEMYKRARNLEFEAAAKLRDQIERLRQLELGFAK